MRRALALLFAAFLLPGVYLWAQDSLLTDARHALADHLPGVALQKLRALLANPGLDPATRTEAERSLTEALLSSGDAQGALARLGEPATPEEQLWKAEALSALGRWSEAAPFYQSVAEHGPASLREAATLGQTESARLSGHPAQAIAYLEHLNAQAPSNLVRLRLAELYLDARQTKAAQQLLARVDSIQPLEAKWRQYLAGRIDLALDQPAPALEAFDTLLKDPHGLVPAVEAGATIGMTEARVILNGLEVADNVLEDFIWHHPESPYLEEMFRRLDGIYATEENPSESELLHWASRLPARRAALGFYYAARLEQREHRQEKALRTYTEFVERYPQHEFAYEAWIQIGELYLETNRISTAVAAFEGAMRSSRNADDRARAEAATGNAYFAEGEYLLAALTFRDSAQRSPGLWLQGTYNAALAWLHLGNYDEFMQDYRTLSERYPESGQRRGLLLEEGLLQARSRDPRAADTLSLFIRDFPDNSRVAEARLALAELALARGDVAQSGELLQVAYESTPSDQPTEQADYLAVFVADTGPDRDDPRVLSLGQKFLEKYPSSALKPQVRMKLGQIYFRREDFANAQTQFESLAEESPADPLADKALILAGQSAVSSMNAGGPAHALALFDRVAKGAGPLKLYARQEQALLEARLGKNKDAIIIYDDILRSSPSAELRLAALCGKADCLVAGALESGGTSATTLPAGAAPPLTPIALYDQIATDPDATAPWRNQALYKKAQCLDRQGSSDQALASLYDILNAPPAAGGKQQPDFFWFEKAGNDAAAMLETKSEWKGAIAILEKVAQASGPGAPEAKKRAEQIRLEHFVWD